MLKDWTFNFINYKNSFQRNVERVVETQTGYDAVTSGGVLHYQVCPLLSDFNSELSDQRIVCLNKRENVTWLLKNWEALIKSDVVILFVNPARHEHWTIRPKHHELVTERADLKMGLQALLESVPEI